MTADREQMAAAALVLLGNSFSVKLNMSDTFAFATADSEEMDTAEFELMVPLILEYGRHALTAYAAFKRGAEPIHCRCGHDDPPFYEALRKVKALKEKHDWFGELD